MAQDCEFILYTLPFLWINQNVSAISNDKVSGNFCLGGGFFLAATAMTIVAIAGLMMLTLWKMLTFCSVLCISMSSEWKLLVSAEYGGYSDLVDYWGCSFV